MSEDNRLPCPFCGGDAEERYFNNYWKMECKDWKCPGKTSCKTIKEAVSYWNTRHTEVNKYLEGE